MTDLVIQGIGGRMGHVLCDMIAQRDDCKVVAGIDLHAGEQNGIPVFASPESLAGRGDVIIDFSSPAAVEKIPPYCQAHKAPPVLCTRDNHKGGPPPPDQLIFVSLQQVPHHPGHSLGGVLQ